MLDLFVSCVFVWPTHNPDARKELYVDEKYVTITTWCIGDLIISYFVPENLILGQNPTFLGHDTSFCSFIVDVNEIGCVFFSPKNGQSFWMKI